MLDLYQGLCQGHYAGINSFNLQDHPMRWDYFLPQFYS